LQQVTGFSGVIRPASAAEGIQFAPFAKTSRLLTQILKPRPAASGGGDQIDLAQADFQGLLRRSRANSQVVKHLVPLLQATTIAGP